MHITQIHLEMLLKQIIIHIGHFLKLMLSHLVQISSDMALHQCSPGLTLESKLRKALALNLRCFPAVTLCTPESGSWTLLPCHITGYPAETWTSGERAQISSIMPESGKTREDAHSTLDGLMEMKCKDTANCSKLNSKSEPCSRQDRVTQSCLLSTEASASLTLWRETKFWQGISYYQEKLHVQAVL